MTASFRTASMFKSLQIDRGLLEEMAVPGDSSARQLAHGQTGQRPQSVQAETLIAHVGVAAAAPVQNDAQTELSLIFTLIHAPETARLRIRG